MNNRFINTLALIASSMIFVSGCGNETNAFKTTDDDSDSTANSGTISQTNRSILADDTQPPVIDPDTGVATDTTVTITVKIGDLNNQLLTDKHTVLFATEWGLIEPSCVTENGICTVNWQTSFGSPMPDFNRTTITAYVLGEEAFDDTNGNGEFDDTDTTFIDREEPFVDANENDIFDAGDTIIDVMNGNDLGQNGVHDNGDGFLNSPNCTHSSLCSTVRSTIYIWDNIALDMNGPPATP